jgi:hypothetical protein
MAPDQPATIADLVTRALAAYDDLAGLGEDVEDEWTYVTDLSGAWHAALAAVAETSGARTAPSSASAAVDAAIAEIGAISDPHRAIDWLSTFPQVILVALGERP